MTNRNYGQMTVDEAIDEAIDQYRRSGAFSGREEMVLAKRGLMKEFRLHSRQATNLVWDACSGKDQPLPARWIW